MYLSEILEDLTYGELSQLFVGAEDGDAGIDLVHYPKIISFINMAMLEIYKKFPIKEQTHTIRLYSDINNYQLLYDYATTNVSSSEDPKYIEDTADDPFEGGVIKIVKVVDQAEVDEDANQDGAVPLNDLSNTASVFTPKPNVLRVVDPVADTLLDITYRAEPVRLDVTSTEPESVWVELPRSMKLHLLTYVGYRAHIAMPAGERTKASEFYAAFRGMCGDTIIQGDLPNTNEGTINEKLDNNGWA